MARKYRYTREELIKYLQDEVKQTRINFTEYGYSAHVGGELNAYDRILRLVTEETL